MIQSQLYRLLNEAEIPYGIYHHHPSYTSQQTAQDIHIDSHAFAKTVILRCHRRELVMVVVPANAILQLRPLARSLEFDELDLVPEYQLAGLFEQCEPGAMPPFGHLFNIPTYLSSDLLDQKQLWFNAGNHQEAIQMNILDYIRLALPRLFSGGVHYVDVSARMHHH
ncbi:aminoacyl-tRNA deacylase [Dongshaea marina]|uniref:aminoacyl-tRNA deacylase n=1 Tax=Dongshaea marina TaxID=2047966 RepID=UPI000D3E3585|nr:YbaK/EbsC family protein [Dongshaea marina]